jgi:hypothetical protein
MSEWKTQTCPPDTHMLVSLRQNGAMTAAKALAEIIDNSFDSGATRVEIDRNGDESLVIADNGAGCEDVSNMVRMGAHYRRGSSTALGRYGIGLKESSVWLCARMNILTSTGTTASKAVVDWDYCIDSKSWDYKVMPVPASSRGTEIEFLRLLPNRLKQWRLCLERVQELFTPGLLLGKQILVNGQPLEPCATPILEHRIEASGKYDGREWELVAGVIPRGAYTKNGYSIHYQHRVIASEITQYGFGQYSCGRIYAQVTLYDGETNWGLSKLKDGIDELEPFLDSLMPYVRPLLEQAKSEEDTLELSSLSGELEAILNASLTKGKEKRKTNPSQDNDGAEPKNTGRKRRLADKVDLEESGEVSPRLRKAELIKIAWDCGQPDLVGKCDGGRVVTVHFNPDHDAIKSLRQNLPALRNVAIMLLGGYMLTQEDGHPLLTAITLQTDGRDQTYDKFLKNVSYWMGQMKEVA